MVVALDTAGQEEYTALRDQWIREGQGFLLVYSVTSRSSFEQVGRFRARIGRVKASSYSSRTRRGSSLPPVLESSRPVPIILVGNNLDRVAEREVSSQEGLIRAKELGCEFIETSARNCINVNEAFYDVVRMIRRQHRVKQAQ